MGSFNDRILASLSDNETLIDKVSTTVTYFCFNKIPGSATSSSNWRILKKTVSGSVTIFRFANANSGFVHVADNRASYTY